MDVSINCQLMGLSVSSRTPPVNQGRFRFPPTADRFIPFRRNSQDSGVKYAKCDDNAENQVPFTPDCEDNNGNTTGGFVSRDGVFNSQDRAIRRQESVREAERRNERTSSANSLDNSVATSILRSQSCDDSSPWSNPRSRVLNFFSPEYNAGRRGSIARKGSQVFSPTPETSVRDEELLLTPPTQKFGRKLPSRPEEVKDLPGIREDAYSQVISWGRKGLLAVAFGNQIYVSDPVGNGKTTVITAPVSFPKGVDVTPLDRTPPRGSVPEPTQPTDVTAVAWDPTGSKLAFGNELGYIWLWKPSLKGSALPVLREGGRKSCDGEEKEGQITSLAWLPASHTSLVFAGTVSCQIEAHDVKHSSSTLVKTTSSPICTMAISPDGRHLAVATVGKRQGTVAIICTQTYKVTWKMKPHSAYVRALAWCPWQPWVLATGGLTDEDGTIKIWSINSEKLLHQSTAGAQVTDLAWSENTMELISAHGGASTSVLVWPWNLSSEPRTLVKHESRVIHLAFSPDGRRLVTASGFWEEVLYIWNGFSKDMNSKMRTPSSSTRSPLTMCIR